MGAAEPPLEPFDEPPLLDDEPDDPEGAEEPAGAAEVVVLASPLEVVPLVDDFLPEPLVIVRVTVIVRVGASESSSERWLLLSPIGCDTSLLAAKVTPAAMQSPSSASTVSPAIFEVMTQF